MRLTIVKALKKVIDPELGVNIVDLGLIYNIIITQNGNINVKIDMTLTTPGCPLSDFFKSEVESVLLDINFIDDVIVNFVWDPPWDLNMMDESTKLKMFNSMRNIS